MAFELRHNTGADLLNYYSIESTDIQHALQYAYEQLDHANHYANNQDDFQRNIVEDIIFSSLYATCYEYALGQINEFPNSRKQIVNQFLDSEEDREQTLLEHSFLHLEYLENDGICHGCSQCEFHNDLEDLLGPWQDKDMEFFQHLYIGTQVIHYLMEKILYDKTDQYPQIIQFLESEHLQNLRQTIFNELELYL